MQKQIALNYIRDFKRHFWKHGQGRTRCDLDSLGTNESQRRGFLQRLPLRPTWADTGQWMRLFCGHGEEKIKTRLLESWREARRPAVRGTNWFCCLRWKTERPVCWIHGCSCRWLTAEGGKDGAQGGGRRPGGGWGRAEGEAGRRGLSVGRKVQESEATGAKVRVSVWLWSWRGQDEVLVLRWLDTIFFFSRRIYFDLIFSSNLSKFVLIMHSKEFKPSPFRPQ